MRGINKKKLLSSNTVEVSRIISCQLQHLDFKVREMLLPVTKGCSAASQIPKAGSLRKLLPAISGDGFGEGGAAQRFQANPPAVTVAVIT